jgi:hypothetical protein
MWLAIGKFFSAVLKFILGIFTGLLNWAREHPREAVIVAVSVALLIASNYWMHGWATARAHAEDAKVIAALQGEVKKANDEAKARDDKIKRIESESKTTAQAMETALKEQKDKAQEIVSEYKEKLKLEKEKYKVIYVKDKDGTEVPVSVDNTGAVMCTKFSQSFFEAVNKLVDNANAPLTLRMSPTITK